MISRDTLVAKVKAKIARRGALTKEECNFLGEDGSAGWRKRLLKPNRIESLPSENLYGYWKAKSGRVKQKERKAKEGKPKSQKKKKQTHKERYYAYLKTDHWKLVRDGLFYRRGKWCERCGSMKDIQVHHKTYENVFQEKAEDLEILCRSCHKKEHDIDQPPKKPTKYTISDHEVDPDGAPF